MSNSVQSAKDFCTWVQHLSGGANYPEIMKAFESPGCFRSMWVNVADEKELFRCRKHSKAEEGILFKHVDELGYRKDAKGIKDFGRCNTPEQGILYLSENPYTCRLETLQDAKANEVYTLTTGRWQMQKTVDAMYVVQPVANRRVHKYEIELGHRYDAHVIDMVKSFPDYGEFSGIYFGYLDSQFKSDQRGLQYQITAAYANMCYTADKSNGLIYASVTDTNFFNVAFDKSVQDSGVIKLIEVVKQTVKVKKDRPKSEADFELLSETLCKKVNGDGSIDWPIS